MELNYFQIDSLFILFNPIFGKKIKRMKNWITPSAISYVIAFTEDLQNESRDTLYLITDTFYLSLEKIKSCNGLFE